MEKQGFKEWISDGILNAYSAIIPLGKNELEYLKNRLMYPEKFLKLQIHIIIQIKHGYQ